MKTEPRQFLTKDGLSLRGDVAGPADAPTVFLLHGGGQTRHSWSKAVTRFVRAGYRVVNFDARGHGESDWSPDGNYSLATMASDLECVMAPFPRPRAFVGASMGGMTSFCTIGSHPAPVADALVMVDITLRPAAAGAAKILDFMAAHADGFASLEDAADAVARYNPTRPRPADTSGLRKNLRQRDGRYFWHWDPRFLASVPRAEPPAPLTNLADLSAHVTLPTLLVRGGRSDIVDDEGVAEMLRLVPQTEVFNVQEAGHMVAGDDNDVFSAGVLTFLQRHLPTSR